MKYYLLTLLSFIVITSSAQQNKAVAKFLSTPGLENASIGICVKDVSGKEIASYNKNQSLTPASTMKIVTTATGLEFLGDDYQFKTTLSLSTKNGQRLIVRGYGDPTLGSEYLSNNAKAFLDSWIEKIKPHIKKNIPLEIEVDDSYFGYSGVSNKWLQEDLGNYYAAGAYGISVFDNSYKLFFNTMNVDEVPTIIKTDPVMKDIVFINTMNLNTTGKDNGYINGEPFSNTRKLVGSIPAKRSSFSIKGDIPNPGLYLAQLLSHKMAANGFSVKRAYTTRDNYQTKSLKLVKVNLTDEKEIYTHYSEPLTKVIRVINERSNNHYSEHLIRTIGRTTDNYVATPFSDPLEDGVARTKYFWKARGLNSDALFMYDGCGLAPSDKISPQLLCDILLYMQDKSKYKEAFLASLPKAGQEGTVRSLLKGTRLEGKVFVKSGSIADVQCFAGYYIEGNKKYAFSVFVNNYNSPRNQVVKAIETLLLGLF